MLNLRSFPHDFSYACACAYRTNGNQALWLHARISYFAQAFSPVYTTENFWHGSGEIGTGPKNKGSARIKFAV